MFVEGHLLAPSPKDATLPFIPRQSEEGTSEWLPIKGHWNGLSHCKRCYHSLSEDAPPLEASFFTHRSFILPVSLSDPGEHRS